MKSSSRVPDGVLLFTFAGDLQQRERLSPSAAVVKAAKIRMRPRIMTTMTTMVGFLPLALNWEEGGDMLQPMAAGAIGGLGMEVLVALFFMPCLFAIFTKRTPELEAEASNAPAGRNDAESGS